MFGWSADARKPRPDCGVRGTIREDAIHFTATLNGRPTSDRRMLFGMDAAKRQR